MTEMTRRERTLASARKERADKLPFFHYWRHIQDGWAERESRNRGMGLNWTRPSYVSKMHGVEVTTKQVQSRPGELVTRRTYTTPVGTIFSDIKQDPGTGQHKLTRSWKAVSPWEPNRLLKGPEDYKVMKYIVENTEYEADYFPIEQAMDWLGDDGVVMDSLPHSPMQMLMIDWVGSEEGRYFYHQADFPEIVEDLYETISKTREPMYEITAKSPAKVALCGDNVDGFLVSPKQFEKFFMPEYEKQAKVMHENGKLMAVHMDGRLRSLKDLIAQTPIDIVEAVHPPPMGDLPIGEALDAWKDKTLWLGYPASVFEEGPKATIKHALDLLRDVGTGERLAIAMSTENQVPNEYLMVLTSVFENAELPLTPDKIDAIERSLN